MGDADDDDDARAAVASLRHCATAAASEGGAAKRDDMALASVGKLGCNADEASRGTAIGCAGKQNGATIVAEWRCQREARQSQQQAAERVRNEATLDAGCSGQTSESVESSAHTPASRAPLSSTVPARTSRRAAPNTASDDAACCRAAPPLALGASDARSHASASTATWPSEGTETCARGSVIGAPKSGTGRTGRFHHFAGTFTPLPRSQQRRKFTLFRFLPAFTLVTSLVT